MQGEPMAQALAAADKVLDRLRPEDRVNVIQFDDSVDQLYARRSRSPPRCAPRPRPTSPRSPPTAAPRSRWRWARRWLPRPRRSPRRHPVHDRRPERRAGRAQGGARRRRRRPRVHDRPGFRRRQALLSRLAAESAAASRSSRHQRRAAGGGRRVRAHRPPGHARPRGSPARSASTPRTLPDLARGEELVVAARLPEDGDLVVSALIDGKRGRAQAARRAAGQRAAAWVGRQWARRPRRDLLQEIAQRRDRRAKNGAIELALSHNLVTPYTSFLALPEEELTDAAPPDPGRRPRAQEGHPGRTRTRWRCRATTCRLATRCCRSRRPGRRQVTAQFRSA
ncbi:MAG: hypothetical protein IPH80_19255 [Myxococcales bacterium]|nr:hypothetical protein [Myxococcales bacterium]